MLSFAYEQVSDNGSFYVNRKGSLKISPVIPDQLSIDLHDEDPPVDLPKTTSAASAVSDSWSQRRDDLRGALRSLLVKA